MGGVPGQSSEVHTISPETQVLPREGSVSANTVQPALALEALDACLKGQRVKPPNTLHDV